MDSSESYCSCTVCLAITGLFLGVIDSRDIEIVRRNNKPFIKSKHSDSGTTELKRRVMVTIKGSSCVDCGNSYPPECMHFDHIKGGKVTDVSRMVNGNYTLNQMLEEIFKCELVCSNCHAIRTKRRHYE